MSFIKINNLSHQVLSFFPPFTFAGFFICQHMKEIIFGRIFLNSILKGANSILLRAKEHLLSEVHDSFVSLENVIKPTKLYCG